MERRKEGGKEGNHLQSSFASIVYIVGESSEGELIWFAIILIMGLYGLWVL